MKKILLNILYTGKYSEIKIGHEVINFFKADNDENYVYVPPLGIISNKNYDDIDMIVFLGNYNNQRCELLGIAKKIETICKYDEFPRKSNVNDKMYENYIKNYIEDIKYSGLSLNKIFDKDEIDKFNPLVNYKVGEMYTVKEGYSVYFTHCSILKIKEKIEYKNSENEKILFHEVYHSLQRQMCYISPNDNYKSEEYDKKHENNLKKLTKELIENYAENYKNDYNKTSDFIDELFKKNVLVKAILPKVENVKKPKNTILSLMDKESDEQIYTNLLSSFFNEKVDGGRKVFEELFDKDGNYQIVKEKTIKFNTDNDKVNKNPNGRIDILAIDEENNKVIIIENKIDSGFNGVIKNGNEKPLCQLNTYQKYFEDLLIKDIKIYILCPDKCKNKIENELSLYEKLNNEPIIMTYGNIIKEINNKKDRFKNTLDGYFEEFMNILKIQTKDKKQITLEKFYSQIEKRNK